MARAVNVVVTCTQRKKLGVVDRLRLQALKQKTVGSRAAEWRRRLRMNGVPKRPARDLYGGDSWSVALQLAEAGKAKGLSPRVWVCSAGYGLVSLDAQLAGYAATFSPGHEDSVSSRSDSASRDLECQDWWQGLATWKGPEPGQPRSLAELAAQSPRTPMLFAGSEAYLRALLVDLGEAGVRLRKKLMVISAGAPPIEGIYEHQLPCDARFQGELGGARQSINVRILKSLLENVPEPDLHIDSAMEVIGKMSENLEPLKKFDRKPMTDDQLREFIRKERAANPKAKHSPLLRKLRDSGFQCEQSRFKHLFQEEARRHGG